MKIVIAIIVAALMATAAQAIPVRDQGFDTFALGNIGVLTTEEWQSFTVGIEGTLTRVDIGLKPGSAPQGLLRLYITEMEAENDALEFFSTASLDASTLTYDWWTTEMVTFNLDTPIDLQLGSQWKIYLRTENGGSEGPHWRVQPLDPYAGGRAANYPTNDNYFFTYMEPGVVSGSPVSQGSLTIPEPSTYAMIFGLGVLAFVGWRRVRS